MIAITTALHLPTESLNLIYSSRLLALDATVSADLFSLDNGDHHDVFTSRCVYFVSLPTLTNVAASSFAGQYEGAWNFSGLFWDSVGRQDRPITSAAAFGPVSAGRETLITSGNGAGAEYRYRTQVAKALSEDLRRPIS